MLAVVILLTVLAQTAVFALFILRTLSALGAEVVFIISGGDAIAMFTAF